MATQTIIIGPRTLTLTPNEITVVDMQWQGEGEGEPLPEGFPDIFVQCNPDRCGNSYDVSWAAVQGGEPRLVINGGGAITACVDHASVGTAHKDKHEG